MRFALTALTLALALTTAAAQTDELATVDFNDQTTDGTYVTVDEAFLPEGGFIVIHDDTMSQDAIGSVVGVSEYLTAAIPHNDIRIEITLSQQDTGTETGTETGTDPENDTGGGTTVDPGMNGHHVLHAMAHHDTNDNEVYDFESSAGQEDIPYTDDGNAVTDEGNLTVQETQPAQPGDNDSVEDPDTDNDTPGLGVLASVGLLAALAVMRRRV